MLPFHEIALRLGVAALLGVAIGVERDIRRRPAGIRTSLLVCLSTALFTILSGEISMRFGDTGSTRIASNIVQGIGFLGAGAILRDSGSIVGMTTAATIFVEAAIGMAAGGGFYAAAAYTTGLVLFALVVLSWLAQALNLKPRLLAFRVTSRHEENVAAEMHRLLAGLKISALHFRVSTAGSDSVVEFEADVKHKEQETIMHQLNRSGVTTEVTPIDGPHE